MCICVCLHPLPSGLVKRETKDRRAREDKGGHQTVDPGCCSPHQKRGGKFCMTLSKNWWTVCAEVNTETP